MPRRYKVMGIVGSVWGISSIVGPLLGGAILESLNWSSYSISIFQSLLFQWGLLLSILILNKIQLKKRIGL